MADINDALGMLVGAFEDEYHRWGRVVPLESGLNTRNKIVPIRRLEIYFGRGQTQCRNTRGTRVLVNQLRDFPSADHDDGPHALEPAVRRLELMTNPR